MAVAGVERDARRAGDRFVAARLADGRREIGSPAGEARLDRDVREMLGGERAAVALQRGAEQHAGELADVAGPAVAHQHAPARRCRSTAACSAGLLGKRG